MKFIELAQKRYSVRGYQNKPVEEEKLKELLEAARLAPTGGNRQQFQLIVVHTAGRAEELKTIYKAEWFTQAPVVIVACATVPEGAALPGSRRRPQYRHRGRPPGDGGDRPRPGHLLDWRL